MVKSFPIYLFRIFFFLSFFRKEAKESEPKRCFCRRQDDGEKNKTHKTTKSIPHRASFYLVPENYTRVRAANGSSIFMVRELWMWKRFHSFPYRHHLPSLVHRIFPFSSPPTAPNVHPFYRSARLDSGNTGENCAIGSRRENTFRRFSFDLQIMLTAETT
jgi:hypothetical protein